MLSGAMIVFVYYIPIYFQAIKGVDAVQSGVDVFPLVISLVVASVISGGLANKTGYYVPQLLVSSVLTSVGAGLITTWVPSTSSHKWIGYQILVGFGMCSVSTTLSHTY